MKRLLVTGLTLLLTTGAIAQVDSRQQSVRVVPVPDNNLEVRIWTDKREYRVGENITINYRATRDAYVLIFSESPDGETRQLLPNSYDSENYVQGGRTYTIPNRGYRLEVTPPTGQERLSIVAFTERNRAMEEYRRRKSEAFPKSDGPDAAIARIEPRPDGRGRRYAKDSTTIRISRSGWDNGGGRPGHDNGWDTGRLRIDSDPDSAYVYVNGAYRGITPLDLGSIRTGTYDIVIYRPGYYQARRRVRVDEGERQRVDEDLRLIRYY